ncbi:MAG: ABC transporter substrate-binding protein [Firmicutes bacterium]|nr:ABC transporter substrate-binding protein [Bacillota bacterium]
MKKRCLCVLLCFVLVASLLSGCAGNKEATGGQNELINIKISTIAGLSWAPLFVAASEGFFEEEGLKVEFITPGGPKGFQAMHAGECEFSMLSQEPLLIAQEQGIRSTIIATMLKSRVYGIIASPDIQNVSDLKGTVIYGSDPGSAPYTFTWSVLEGAGLDPQKDVTFMQMQADAAITALERGEIKAAFINMSKMPELKDIDVNVLIDTTKEDDSLKYLGAIEFPAEMLCATEEYAKNNPDACQKLVNAIINAQAWIQEHTDREVAESVSTELMVTDLDILSEGIAIMRAVYSSDCHVSEEGQNAVVNMCLNSGLISEMIPYSEIVDMTFVNNYSQ